MIKHPAGKQIRAALKLLKDEKPFAAVLRLRHALELLKPTIPPPVVAGAVIARSLAQLVVMEASIQPGADDFTADLSVDFLPTTFRFTEGGRALAALGDERVGCYLVLVRQPASRLAETAP